MAKLLLSEEGRGVTFALGPSCGRRCTTLTVSELSWPHSDFTVGCCNKSALLCCHMGLRAWPVLTKKGCSYQCANLAYVDGVEEHADVYHQNLSVLDCTSWIDGICPWKNWEKRQSQIPVTAGAVGALPDFIIDLNSQRWESWQAPTIPCIVCIFLNWALERKY